MPQPEGICHDDPEKHDPDKWPSSRVDVGLEKLREGQHKGITQSHKEYAR